MSLVCTRCSNSGFLNIEEPKGKEGELDCNELLEWAKDNAPDMQICDCCGNGEDSWYGTPGEHYNSDDPPGYTGPYAYNGGLCECH